MGTGYAMRAVLRALLLALALGLVAAPPAAGAAGWAPGGDEIAPRTAFAEHVPAEPSPLEPLPAEPFGLVLADPAAHADAARWRVVLQAVEADRAVLARCRQEPARCPQPAARLLAVLQAAEGREGRARLGAINRAVNLALAYATDEAQHGVADLWSAPLASFAAGRADCEDYAIVKYLALVELGLPAADLRMVVVKRRAADQHAVLAVRLDGRWLVLDNARLAMVEDRDLSDYRAVMAFGPAPGASPAAATRIAMAAPEPPVP